MNGKQRKAAAKERKAKAAVVGTAEPQQAWASKHVKGGKREAPEEAEEADGAGAEATVHSIKEAHMKKAKRKTELKQLPPLPKLKAARMRPTRDCECGCGEKTKARFAPGHDSWQRGLMMRLERGMLDRAWMEENLGAGQIAAIDAKVKEAKAEARKAAKAAKVEAAETVVEEAEEAEVAANDE